MPITPDMTGGSIEKAAHDSILEAIPDAAIRVTGGGGHFSIEVVSPVFRG